LPERFRRSVPWGMGDLLAIYATTFIGLLLVFLAWFGSSASVRLNNQVRWTTVGVAGVIVLGAGNLFWLLRGKRATGELRRLLLLQVPVDDEAPVEAPRAGPLVAGKDVTAASKDAHVRSGREACGVCLPPETGP
jgi:hypothetical protein